MKIPVGPTSVLGGGVTLAAYMAAIAAFAGGQHDAVTISTLAVGTLSLLATMAGRFAQAHAVIKHSVPVAPPAPAPTPAPVTPMLSPTPPAA